MLKNIQAKVPDKSKAAQDLKITVQSVVDAIRKFGHEEKDGHGDGTICSAAKIKPFFTGNDPEADAIIIGLRLKEALKMGVDEGAFHRPEKSAISKISLQGSFVVPHNNNHNLLNVIEPGAITKEKPIITCTNGKKTQQEPTSSKNKLVNNSARAAKGKSPNSTNRLAVQQKPTLDSKNLKSAQSQHSSGKQKQKVPRGDSKRFVIAAQAGDLETLQDMHLKFDGMIVNRFHDGKTALHEACRFGHKTVIEWLFGVAKADIEKQGGREKGFRAIHWAVEEKLKDVLEILIEKGAEMDSQCRKGWTALHIAIKEESPECFNTLIQAGCDINKQNLQGRSPLHYSLHSKNDRYVDELMASNRLLYTDWKKRCDRLGWNLLHHAVGENNIRLVQLISKNGVKNDDLSKETTINGRTALHVACYDKNVQIAKILLDHQRALATPNGSALLMEAKNIEDMTALMVSFFKMDFPTIELLIQAGADLKASRFEEICIPLYYPLTCAKRENQVPSIESSPGIFKNRNLTSEHF